LLTIIPQASTNILHEATRISSALNGALSTAESLSQIHAEASHSTSQLIKTISLLTETTHFELEKINASSNLLQQELLFVRRYDREWWQDLFIRIAQNIFYGEPIYLIHNVSKIKGATLAEGTSPEYILHIPLVRFLFSSLTLLWTLFRATFSTLTVGLDHGYQVYQASNAIADPEYNLDCLFRVAQGCETIAFVECRRSISVSRENSG
jgi:hypothetical protein